MYNKHKITMYGYNMHVIFIHSNFREAILSIVKDTSFIPKYYFSYLTKFSVAQCVIYVLFIYSNFRETIKYSSSCFVLYTHEESFNLLDCNTGIFSQHINLTALTQILKIA